MKIDRRLVQVSLIALLIYGLYLFFGPEQVALPLPTKSKNEAIEKVQTEIDELQLPMLTKEDLYYTDFSANSSIGRYVEQNQLNAEEFATLQKEVSLYGYEIASLTNSYLYDFEHDYLTHAENVYLQVDEEQFVKSYFGDEYTLKGTEETESFFLDWDIKQTYVAETTFSDIINVVDLYIEGDAIVSFKQYALALGFPKEEESIAQIIASLFILLFLIGLVLFVTVHLIIKLVKKEIEAFWEPFGLSLAAGVGWLYINQALGANIFSFSIIEPLIMTYLTFATLLIRWKRDDRPLTKRLTTLQPAVVHGLLLTVIALLLAEGFFFIAQFVDTWVSPVTMHNVLVELELWYIPVFTLFIGLSAAITEEAIFRHYMIPFFERGGIFLALVMTSFLWGIMHIGYDMYPWYLYVLEFFILTGPFFFFVYKRYGFATAIFMHYFYNAWVTTLFLFGVDLKVAFVSLLVMLSPFLLCLIRNKKETQPIGVEQR